MCLHHSLWSPLGLLLSHQLEYILQECPEYKALTAEHFFPQEQSKWSHQRHIECSWNKKFNHGRWRWAWHQNWILQACRLPDRNMQDSYLLESTKCLIQDLSSQKEDACCIQDSLAWSSSHFSAQQLLTRSTAVWERMDMQLRFQRSANNAF